MKNPNDTLYLNLEKPVEKLIKIKPLNFLNLIPNYIFLK